MDRFVTLTIFRLQREVSCATRSSFHNWLRFSWGLCTLLVLCTCPNGIIWCMAEGSHIEIASSHASIEDLKRKAVETPPIVKPSSEKRPSLQEVPLYFGAVFKGGKNEVHVDRPDLISTLDVNDEKDRTRFIFKNIHAFDYRYGKGSAWKVVVDDWIKDYEIANEGANIDSRAEEEFLGKLKAAMAVTASARAMDSSGGSAKSYMVNLVGANERGEPITGEQDLSSSFLLHADPGKLNLVINFYFFHSFQIS